MKLTCNVCGAEVVNFNSSILSAPSAVECRRCYDASERDVFADIAQDMSRLEAQRRELELLSNLFAAPRLMDVVRKLAATPEKNLVIFGSPKALEAKRLAPRDAAEVIAWQEADRLEIVDTGYLERDDELYMLLIDNPDHALRVPLPFKPDFDLPDYQWPFTASSPHRWQMKTADGAGRIPITVYSLPDFDAPFRHLSRRQRKREKVRRAISMRRRSSRLGASWKRLLGSLHEGES